MCKEPGDQLPGMLLHTQGVFVHLAGFLTPLLDACGVSRCRTVVRVPEPESKWNTMRLPVTTNAIATQRWLVSPVYFFFDQCTCTKVGTACRQA